MVLPKKWQLIMTAQATKQLSRLDKAVQKRLLEAFETKILTQDNPRLFGKQLTGPLRAYWCYRIGDYRVVTDIQDGALTLVAISIAHRRHVYT